MLESYPIVYFVKKKNNVAGTVSRVLMHVCIIGFQGVHGNFQELH